MYGTWCKAHFIPEKLTVSMGNNGRQQWHKTDESLFHSSHIYVMAVDNDVFHRQRSA